MTITRCASDVEANPRIESLLLLAEPTAVDPRTSLGAAWCCYCTAIKRVQPWSTVCCWLLDCACLFNEGHTTSECPLPLHRRNRIHNQAHQSNSATKGSHLSNSAG